MSTRSPRPPRPNDRYGFEIAIICALPLEADAIEALFDHHWDDDGPSFGKELGDPNAYSTGVIGCHNVVLAYMPGMGKANAAAVASHCRASFQRLRLALIVGVCGVVPFKLDKDEIVLGDVIISDGIVQYDFGRQMPARFVRKDTLWDSLGRPNQEIREVLTKLRSVRYRQQLRTKMADYLNDLCQEPELHAEYPGSTKDRLFEASYCHTENDKSCEELGCNGELVLRSRLEPPGICPTSSVHFGLMASGDAVMKSGEDRDQIAMAEGVIAFEMEGAGVWDRLPCVVIKGACDYADGHKSKGWQRYAAATAAACAKAFLGFWDPSPEHDISRLASNLQSSLSLQSQNPSDQSQVARATDEHSTRPIFLVPFSKNDLFVGRDDILARVQGLLFDQGRRNAAIVGLGGIGKTQIALRVAYWVKETKQDYSVFWMPALSRASFEQACMQIKDACDIPTSGGADAIESVRQYLSSKRAGKWLLVIDNADDIRTVKGSAGEDNGIFRSLPMSDEGRILFTTRDRSVAISAAGRHIMEIPAMSRDEARSYFKEALIQETFPSDEQVTDHLLELLTYLPLAITQAAAYLNEHQISITEYLHLFQNTDRNRTELLSAEFQDDTRYEQSQDPVATTWFISFNQIRKANELASRILMFMAYVEPKAVPQSMLPRGNSRQQLVRAIGMLCGYGFLSRRGSSEVFDMHNLVHLAIQSWVAENDPEKRQRQETVARLSGIFPTADWENRKLWRQYLPHAIKLLNTSKYDWSEELCELGCRAGRCLLMDGRVMEAVELLEHVVAVEAETLTGDHPGRLALQHTIAGAYHANGQIAEAVQLLEHIVAVEETTLAEEDLDRLASQHALAGAYHANGQITEAVQLLEYIVAVEAETLAEDHPARLASYHALAGAYHTNGQTTEAVELLKYVVMARNAILAEDHPDRLASQHELARAYQANGQITEAVELLEHVVMVRNETLAEDHPNRLASQHELARIYNNDNQTKKAVELLEHVVTVREKIFAEHHPSRLASQHSLAVAYRANGQIEKAVELLEHVVAIEAEILPENHPDRLASYHELAAVYLADSQTKKAIGLLEFAVAVDEKTLAEDHPGRLASQHSLTKAYHANGQTAEAVELLEHVVMVQNELLVENHPDRLASQHDLAELYQANGQIVKAIELLEYVVKIREKTLPEDHPDRLASQHSLAEIYRASENINEAVALLECVVAIRQKTLAEDHPSLLASQHNLAEAYRANGQVSEAIQLLECVVSIRRKTLAADHPYRLASERELAVAHETNAWIEDDSDHLDSESSNLSWSNAGGSTHPSTLSSGLSATKFQTAHDLPIITPLRYKKPEADRESGERDDDIQSVASVSDDVGSLAESKYDKMGDIRQAAMSYFVGTLTGIPVLLSLYERAAKVMSEAKFVRNHRRMLKVYYLGLRAEGKTPSQRFAIQFLRSRSNRIQISLQIHRLVTPSESTVREHVAALFEQKHDKFLMLNRFLNERNYTDRQASSNHAHYASHASGAEKHDETPSSGSDTDSDVDNNLDEKYETQLEGNDLLSTLEVTKEFFINGQPFLIYQNRMHDFLNHAHSTAGSKGGFGLSQSVQDLRSLEAADKTRRLVHSKASKMVTVQIWWLWLMTKFYPPPAGHHRISYICGCGELSYLDVKELSRGGIERLQQRIVSSASAARKHAPDPATLPVSPNPPALPAPVRMRNMVSQTLEMSRRQGPATSSRPDFQPTGLTSRNLCLSSPDNPQFLLVCINTRRTTILEHIDVSTYSNDQHMFKEISDVYRSIRVRNEWGFSLPVPSWLHTVIRTVSARLPSPPSPLNSLNILSKICVVLSQVKSHRIASADFVRFQMIPIGRGTFPGWFKKRQFPPEDQVSAGKYLYKPVPRDDVDFLEIPLSHLLKPGDHLDNFWIETFPKKLSEPLVRKCGVDGQRVIGWGIRINEELDWRYALLLVLGVLLATGAGVVSYAVVTSDKSSAFGMGAYLVAVFTTYITYQYLAWRDDL